jgi:hypothetical protein
MTGRRPVVTTGTQREVHAFGHSEAPSTTYTITATASRALAMKPSKKARNCSGDRLVVLESIGAAGAADCYRSRSRHSRAGQ